MALESVTIRDDQCGSAADILVGFGFNCYRFRAAALERPVEVLWSEAGFAGGQKRASGSGIPILFPFPGRIQGTQLSWQGRTYPLEPGDGRGNAIHGFVLNRPWRVVKQLERQVTGQFQASVDDPQIMSHWPSDFRITATYRIEGNQLDSEFRIENPGQSALPCGLGTHPYFRVPLGGGSADSCVVRVPVTQSWELVEMNVTGRVEDLEDVTPHQQGWKFVDTAFDHVFGGLEFSGQWCEASITDPASGQRVVTSFDRAFRECVVYNPPHRDSICIEPYTCVPDPFRLSTQGVDAGLRILDPGQSFVARVSIRVEPSSG